MSNQEKSRKAVDKLLEGHKSKPDYTLNQVDEGNLVPVVCILFNECRLELLKPKTAELVLMGNQSRYFALTKGDMFMSLEKGGYLSKELGSLVNADEMREELNL